MIWDKEKIEKYINDDKPVVIIDEEYFKENFIRRDEVREILNCLEADDRWNTSYEYGIMLGKALRQLLNKED